MSAAFIIPEFGEESFHCPHCGVLSHMKWSITHQALRSNYVPWNIEDLASAICAHCDSYSLWLDSTKRMIFPSTGSAPLPNLDMPDEIISDYMEARTITSASPRGAAALLRLCIQKLCIHLGESGRDINKDIASLVKQGLNTNIQKSLDVVRVIGNEAVHPGTIDLNDDPDIALMLFRLVNIIADALITQPKMINEAYELLPPSKRDGIDKRDGK